MEPSERIPHDDWVDQDLLTRDEAADRLASEIAEVTERVDAGEADDLLLRRLAGMREALARMRAG